MKRKKSIKKLMALGIPRNDAAGFVSTCNALKAAGKKVFLPEIMVPPGPPVSTIRTDYQLRRFETQMRVSDRPDLVALLPTDTDEYIRNTLAKEMGLALMKTGAISISTVAHPPSIWDPYCCVEYRAAVNVAVEVSYE